MYIIRLKKKWNKGAPTGACSFCVMRNLWNEIRVILACLVLFGGGHVINVHILDS